MVALLQTLREAGYLVGIVGAGDFDKQQGQLGGPDLRERLDFCFSENGDERVVDPQTATSVH